MENNINLVLHEGPCGIAWAVCYWTAHSWRTEHILVRISGLDVTPSAQETELVRVDRWTLDKMEAEWVVTSEARRIFGGIWRRRWHLAVAKEDVAVRSCFRRLAGRAGHCLVLGGCRWCGRGPHWCRRSTSLTSGRLLVGGTRPCRDWRGWCLQRRTGLGCGHCRTAATIMHYRRVRGMARSTTRAGHGRWNVKPMSGIVHKGNWMGAAGACWRRKGALLAARSENLKVFPTRSALARHHPCWQHFSARKLSEAADSLWEQVRKWAPVALNALIFELVERIADRCPVHWRALHDALGVLVDHIRHARCEAVKDGVCANGVLRHQLQFVLGSGPRRRHAVDGENPGEERWRSLYGTSESHIDWQASWEKIDCLSYLALVEVWQVHSGRSIDSRRCRTRNDRDTSTVRRLQPPDIVLHVDGLEKASAAGLVTASPWSACMMRTASDALSTIAFLVVRVTQTSRSTDHLLDAIGAFVVAASSADSLTEVVSKDGPWTPWKIAQVALYAGRRSSHIAEGDGGLGPNRNWPL